MYRIELLNTHTHANEVHFKGAVIEVDEATATWLLERGIGRVAPAAPVAAIPEPRSAETPAASDTKPNRKAKE